MRWHFPARVRHPGAMQQVLAYAQRLAADVAVAAEQAGGRLLAAYVHGSAALGGWVPGRSDVDVLFVAADTTGAADAVRTDTAPADTAPADTAPAETGAADSMARALVAAGPACPGRELEASIVGAAAARDPGPPWPYIRHVVAGQAGTARVVCPDSAAPGDRDLLMHYAVCRAAGLAVLGPPASELIGPIARVAILAYLADELDWGLANAPESYAVLNACRARAYWSDDAIIGKIAGGETALRRASGPADLITRALAQQRGEQPDRPPAPDAIEFALATAVLLRSGLGRPGS
jgi:hypothetical protein